MKKDFQYSSTRLLKNYIESANKYQVIMQDVNDSSVNYNDQNASIIAKAREIKAMYYIVGSLNRLGENVIVNINLFGTETGKKVWFDQLKAMNPDDLDPILQRIGQNMGTENKATNSDDIYSVTNQESQNLKQREATNNFGVGLCALPLLMHGFDFNNSSQLSGLSLAWSFDARNYIFDIKPSWCFNSTYNMLSLSLEMNKPLTKKSNTPFLGGGASLTRTSFDVKNNNSSYYSDSYTASGYGIMLLAGGGYIFNRTSSVSVRLSANLMQGFYDVTMASYDEYNQTTQKFEKIPGKNYGLSTGILMRLEILFRR
ncbi:MAG: autotransporter outer membrane beta-barrel domain-containing protein [Bacteroidia bacterium]|nr:autotransporter outer membrane beta-barrel domain-containing protein [Bacteroidia bacterium]